MNFLEWGANWLQGVATQHTEVEVTVSNDGVSYQANATLVDEQGRMLPGNLPLVVENTRFMFRAAQVASLGIVFKRNTIITYGSQNYEVVPQSNRFWVYNDVFKKHVVVDTKQVV